MSKILGGEGGRHDQHFVKNKFVKNKVGGREVNLNFDNVHKYTGFFLEVTPKGKKLNHLGKKTQPGKKTRPLGENLTIGEENSTIWGKIRPWGKKTRPFGGKFDHWGRKLDHLGKKIRPFGGKFDHWGRISTIWGKTRPK